MYGAEGDWVAWLYGNLILVILGNIVGGGLVVGTHFTCFAGTKLFVQNYEILTLHALSKVASSSVLSLDAFFLVQNYKY